MTGNYRLRPRPGVDVEAWRANVLRHARRRVRARCVAHWILLVAVCVLYGILFARAFDRESVAADCPYDPGCLERVTDPITDTDVGCVDDCLAPAAPAPRTRVPR